MSRHRGSPLLRNFLVTQKRIDPEKTQDYWAERWGISRSTLAKWLDGTRFIGRRNGKKVFRDVPFTRDDYETEVLRISARRGVRGSDRNAKAGADAPANGNLP